MTRRLASLLLAAALAACGPAATRPAPAPPPPTDPCARLVLCYATIGATLCSKVPNPDNCRAAFSLQITGFDALTCQMALRSLTDTLTPYQPDARGWTLPEVCR
ncbi:MAG TPA: hypothetical protein VGQ83_27230 [Polyangia bacterium]|jgi:hypothetical protein